MKDLIVGQVGGMLGYEAKIEDGKLKISAVVDLAASVDEIAKMVPGDSAVEMLICQLAKSAIKAI
jgi:hypothetical protein